MHMLNKGTQMNEISNQGNKQEELCNYRNLMHEHEQKHN